MFKKLMVYLFKEIIDSEINKRLKGFERTERLIHNSLDQDSMSKKLLSYDGFIKSIIEEINKLQLNKN